MVSGAAIIGLSMGMFGALSAVQADEAAIKAMVKEHNYPMYLDKSHVKGDHYGHWYPKYLDRDAETK